MTSGTWWLLTWREPGDPHPKETSRDTLAEVIDEAERLEAAGCEILEQLEIHRDTGLPVTDG